MGSIDQLSQLECLLVVGGAVSGVVGSIVGSINISKNRIEWSSGEIIRGACYGLCICFIALAGFSSHIHDVMQVFGFVLVSCVFVTKLWPSADRINKLVDERIGVRLNK